MLLIKQGNCSYLFHHCLAACWPNKVVPVAMSPEPQLLLELSWLTVNQHCKILIFTFVHQLAMLADIIVRITDQAW
jgi:hypothetical protein